MNFLDATMSAGLCAIVLGGVFVVLLGIKRGRGKDIQFLYNSFGWRLDLSMCFVWGGILMVQVANILMRKESGQIYNVSALGWAGTAGDIFICGVFGGRLLLRREMRLDKEKRQEPVTARAGATSVQ